jgi:hypothetical protein
MSFFSEDRVLEMPLGPDPCGSRSIVADAVREALRSRFTGILDVNYGDDTHFVSPATSACRNGCCGHQH